MPEPVRQHAPIIAEQSAVDDGPAAGLLELVQTCRERFESRFGRVAERVVVSPGRVNLIGEHVDYNDGFVLPMAIERYLVIAAAPISSQARAGGESRSAPGERVIHLASTRQEKMIVVDLSEPVLPGEPGWGNYARGVIAGFQERGVTVPPFEAMIAANLPTGGGLSSSAALEVALATLLEEIAGVKLEKREKALLCQHAEHTFAGVPCGIMDQFACALGRHDHLLLLDCRSLAVEFVPFRDPKVTLLVIDSKVKHELTGGEYALRRRECAAATAKLGVTSLRDLNMADFNARAGNLSGLEQRRTRHVLSEIERTQAAVAAIRASDWKRVGQLMYESHFSLRVDFEVSCSELDLIVDIARELSGAGSESVYGCRMTGGGFGGCAICLVRSDAVEAVSGHISREYQRRIGVVPELFSTRPAAGASVFSPAG